MKKTLITIAVIILAAIALVAALKISKFNNNNSPQTGNELNSPEATSTVKDESTPLDNNVAGIANPASVNCSTLGGNLVIQKRGDGGEYGLCYFEDNRACEEWALMRGDCPTGGVKTTGFDTIDQNFCAWSGGETFAVPQSVCTFKNGSKCSTIDFYDGQCSPAA